MAKKPKKERSALAFRSLMADVWRDIKAHWRGLLWAVAIVMVPASLLSSTSTASDDSSLSAYIAIATLVMNGALIWTALQIVAGESWSTRKAYFQGVATVRLMLLTFLLVLALLPAGLGLVFYVAAVSGATIALGEHLLVGLLALLLALPSILLLTRMSLAPYVLHVEPELGPWQATARSRELTSGRFWLLLGKILQLGLVTALIVAPLAVLFGFLGSLLQNEWPLIVLQIVAAIATVPLVHLYMARLHTELAR